MDWILSKRNVCVLYFLTGAAHASVSGLVHSKFRWQKGDTVPVCFENPSTSNHVGRQMVEYIVKNSWEKVANINFDFKSSACGTANVGIRIKVSDSVPLVCEGRPQSHPGRPRTCIRWENDEALFAKMLLNFTFVKFKGAMSPVAADTASRRKQINRMIFHYAIHEFGHAIGLLHETDRTYRKLDAGARFCSDDDGEQEIGGVNVSYYDIHSVMHYLCNAAGNWKNGPPITLSCGDMSTVRWMYGDRNTHIGPNCLEAHAKNLELPAKTLDGYSVPAGGYDIGSGADTYETVVTPNYQKLSDNGYHLTLHTTPVGTAYSPTVEPKITMSINPETKVCTVMDFA